MEQKKKGLIIGLAAFACFVSIRSYSFIMASGQEKIIIYNIPGYRAIDFIRGRDCFFYGDSVLLADEFIRNLYIEPSRVSNRLFPVPAMNDLVIRDNFITYGSVKMLLADGPVAASAGGKYDLDILVISRDAGITLRGFANTFKTRQVVFESSIPYWKLKTWKKDCDSLHIPYYDVSEKGAFVMSLN